MANSKVEQNRKATCGRKKGSLKTGGRKKGTPNKKTLQLVEVLGAFNPVEKLKEIYNLTDDYSIKSKICLDLLKYLYPQRKAVDFEVGEETLNLIEAANKIKEALDD